MRILVVTKRGLPPQKAAKLVASLIMVPPEANAEIHSASSRDAYQKSLDCRPDHIVCLAGMLRGDILFQKLFVNQDVGCMKLSNFSEMPSDWELMVHLHAMLEYPPKPGQNAGMDRQEERNLGFKAVDRRRPKKVVRLELRQALTLINHAKNAYGTKGLLRLLE